MEISLWSWSQELNFRHLCVQYVSYPSGEITTILKIQQLESISVKNVMFVGVEVPPLNDSFRQLLSEVLYKPDQGAEAAEAAVVGHKKIVGVY